MIGLLPHIISHLTRVSLPPHRLMHLPLRIQKHTEIGSPVIAFQGRTRSWNFMSDENCQRRSGILHTSEVQI